MTAVWLVGLMTLDSGPQLLMKVPHVAADIDIIKILHISLHITCNVKQVMRCCVITLLTLLY